MTNKYESFATSYSGRNLLKKHNLSDEGTWCIYGEDPNTDWGGHHHEPILAYVRGTLESAIIRAVENPAFWGWGCGRIESVNILS